MSNATSGSKRALPWAMLAAWMVLPALLWWMSVWLDNLIPMAAHQVYYLPLGSWLGPPFFVPDGDLGFWVKPAGRWVTATFYLGVATLITFGLDRLGRWRNTLWRQLMAFTLLLALSLAASHFFNIHGRAYIEFSYDRNDALAHLCALWFALFGGWISGRYRFGIAAALLYLVYGVLGMYYVQNAFHVGWVQAFSVNAAHIAVSMAAAALGACTGVFIQSPRRHPTKA